MTRKEAHAEAITFLAQAVDALDQAHSYFKDATSENALNDGRVSIRLATTELDTLLKYAKESICEDCDKPIAECDCWFNKPVGDKDR